MAWLVSISYFLSSICLIAPQIVKSIQSLISFNLSNKPHLSSIGTLVWKISDYSAKLAEARTKEGYELVSPPFYTSQFGYKLQASLFLNGNGAGENSHLSLYIKLLPGEYDALLRWPFAHSVAFTLFDQSEKVNIMAVAKHFLIVIP